MGLRMDCAPRQPGSAGTRTTTRATGSRSPSSTPFRNPAPGSDGAPDLAVSAPGADGGAGEVWLLYGNRLARSGASGGAVLLFDGENDGQPGARAGTSLASGRFDSVDGDDLVIGAPRPGCQRRSQRRWHPRRVRRRLDPSPLVEFTRDDDAAPAQGDRLGAALAAGILAHCPGTDSLVIGVPGKDVSGVSDAGALFVVTPSSGGLNATGSTARFVHQGSLGVPGGSGSGDRFGAAVLVADVGLPALAATRARRNLPAGCLPAADIVVGVPGDDVGARSGAGAVVVLYHQGGPQRTTGNQRWHQDQADWAPPESGDGFGAVLSAGRFGPGEALALVVGVPGEDVGSIANAGVASPSSAPASVASPPRATRCGTRISAGIKEIAQPGDRFGTGLPTYH